MTVHHASPRRALRAATLSATVSGALLLTSLPAAAPAAEPTSVPPAPTTVSAKPASGLVVGDRRVVTDGSITSIRRDGKKLLVNGLFDHVGVFSGSAITLGEGSGKRLGFTTFDHVVSTSVPDGSGGWYVAGDFETVGGDAQRYLAHVAGDGTVVDDLPAPDGPVWSLGLSDGLLYVGGVFDRVGERARDGLAAIRLSDGAVTGFAPQADGIVTELLPAPAAPGRTARVFASVVPDYYEGAPALQAYDAATGDEVAGFTPGTRRGVGGELALLDDTLYVGRGGVDAIDATTGDQVPGFDTGGLDLARAESDQRVSVLAVDDGRLLVGGAFSDVAGRSGGLIAVDPTTGDVVPGFSARVRSFGRAQGTDDARGVVSVAVDGDRLWIGGQFAVAGGKAASNVAALDRTTGDRVTRDTPEINEIVHTATVSGDRVFVGGLFSMLGAIEAKGLATLDARTLRPISGSTHRVPYRYSTMMPVGRTLYLADTRSPGPDGGRFADGAWYGGSERVVAVDARTGKRLKRLTTKPIRRYLTATVGGGRLYTVRRLDDRRFPRTQVTVRDARTGRTLTSYVVGLRGYATTARVQGSKLLLAGSFKRRRGNGQQANLAVIRLRPSGIIDTAFDPHVDGPVHDLSDAGTPLLLSGAFHRRSGKGPRGGVVRVSPGSGSPLRGWWSSAGGTRSDISVAGSWVFAGSTNYPGGRLLRLSDGRTVTPPDGMLRSRVRAIESRPGGGFVFHQANTYSRGSGGGSLLNLSSIGYATPTD
ncbi:MAG: hypothetical protein CMH83_04850 [Nocardioides sp.]|nr:hypothetical protein [Nocardioides sp.]